MKTLTLFFLQWNICCQALKFEITLVKPYLILISISIFKLNFDVYENLFKCVKGYAFVHKKPCCFVVVFWLRHNSEGSRYLFSMLEESEYQVICIYILLNIFIQVSDLHLTFVFYSAGCDNFLKCVMFYVTPLKALLFMKKFRLRHILTLSSECQSAHSFKITSRDNFNGILFFLYG